mmetsp:Transcript_28274/g.83751  ORF Transcript_28274/g.83751 Transcript_28274/m.83751 type:complete len:172 (-) Transcript_28274:851-1366(-)
MGRSVAPRDTVLFPVAALQRSSGIRSGVLRRCRERGDALRAGDRCPPAMATGNPRATPWAPLRKPRGGVKKVIGKTQQQATLPDFEGFRRCKATSRVRRSLVTDFDDALDNAGVPHGVADGVLDKAAPLHADPGHGVATAAPYAQQQQQQQQRHHYLRKHQRQRQQRQRPC